MPCSPFYTQIGCCFSRWMPFARVDPRVRSWSASSASGGRLVWSASIAHKSWCWKSGSFSSEVLASSFASCTASVASVALRIGYYLRLAMRFRSCCRAWTAVGGAGSVVQVSTKSSRPSSRLSPFILIPVRISHGTAHRGKAEVACSASPESSHMAPFLVTPLSPHSVAFTNVRFAFLISIVLSHVRFGR